MTFIIYSYVNNNTSNNKSIYYITQHNFITTVYIELFAQIMHLYSDIRRHFDMCNTNAEVSYQSVELIFTTIIKMNTTSTSGEISETNNQMVWAFAL